MKKPTTKNKPAPKVVEKVIVKEVEVDDADVDENFELDGDEVEQKLNEFRARFTGKQYKVRTERRDEMGRWAWCDRVPMDAFDPFSVFKKFGAGEYRAVLLDEGGQYVKGGIMEFSFAKPLEVEDSNKDGGAHQIVIESMKANQSLLVELLKTAIPAKAEASKPTDIGQLLDALVKMQGMVPRPENSSKSVKETIELAVQLKELMGGGEGKDSGESGGILSDVKEALKLVAEMRGTGGPAAAVPPRPPSPPLQRRPIAGVTVINPKVVQPQGDERPPQGVPEMNPVMKRISVYIPRYLEAGRESASVDVWADFLLNMIDAEVVPALLKQYAGFVDEEGIYSRLLSAGQKPELVEKIFQYAPELNEVHEWCLALVAQAVKITLHEDEVITYPGGDDVVTFPGGDAS